MGRAAPASAAHWPGDPRRAGRRVRRRIRRDGRARRPGRIDETGRGRPQTRVDAHVTTSGLGAHHDGIGAFGPAGLDLRDPVRGSDPTGAEDLVAGAVYVRPGGAFDGARVDRRAAPE